MEKEVIHFAKEKIYNENNENENEQTKERSYNVLTEIKINNIDQKIDPNFSKEKMKEIINKHHENSDWQNIKKVFNNLPLDHRKFILINYNSFIEYLEKEQNVVFHEGINIKEKRKYRFADQEKKYFHGNYPYYYKYRYKFENDNDDNENEYEDVRMKIFKNINFDDKNLLDIGCNTGELTLYIGEKYSNCNINGIDIGKLYF
jgi:2-polyprenyl-3-methyl-5-hydroxy-6-metoxy-1,4-benzoquinol methylase